MDWYEEIGALIAASEDPWFPQVLQGSLQAIVHYDYFLLVQYKRGEPLAIISSDFTQLHMEAVLERFARETYVADPIYRLHTFDIAPEGVVDMRELARMCPQITDAEKAKLSNLVEDSQEEIGFRTRGWPEYLQETCLLVKLDEDRLAAVSLYNFGLERQDEISSRNLEKIFPAVAPLIRKYFKSVMGDCGPDNSLLADRERSGLSMVSHERVSAFFQTQLDTEITPREAELFARLLQGATIAAIADELCISIHTAKTHRRNVYRKIGRGSQTELIGRFHAYLDRQ